VSRSPEIEEIEATYLKKEVPVFNIGDTVRVNTRIKEGNKERIQAFSGTVIAKKGTGLSETFTIYRTAYGSCMDRVFLLHSPRIASIELVRPGRVRRAKLNYIRGKSGKSAKIREQYTANQAKQAPLKKEEVEPAKEEAKAPEQAPEAKEAAPKPEVKKEEKTTPPPKDDTPPTPTDQTPPSES